MLKKILLLKDRFYNSNKMFKSKSYNVKKVSEKSEKEQPSTKTLKPSKKEKKKASAEEVKAVSNKSSPEYQKKNTATRDWHKNKTYSAKNETKKVVIPSTHKKLERK